MITAKQICFGYKKEDQVLNGLSLDLEHPGIYGLLGKNGAGKTTLLKLLAGSLFPDQGQVYIDSISTQERHISSLQQVYYLAERTESPDWPARRLGNIYGKLYPNFDHTQYLHYLDVFEVNPDIGNKSLSMGQQKKVEISFALATQVPYLFMDEPTNGLDILSKKQFRKLISQYTSEQQILIISSHQFREIDRIIDRLLIVDNKKLVLNQSLEVIGEQFLFSDAPSADEQLLYQDEGILGKYGLYTNPSKRISTLDIELLFTAICERPGLLKNIQNYENTF
ncbi:MAG: ATP-binding cassette domain-containing protein [Sphingobacterium sp.]